MERQVGIKFKIGTDGGGQVDALGDDLKRLGVNTADLDARAEALNAELARLAKQQGLIDAFKAQKTAVAAAADTLAAAKQQASELARAMVGVEAPTKAQAKALDDARKAARQAAADYQTQRLELQQLRGHMAAAGVAADGLAAAQVRVRKESTTAAAGLSALQGDYRALAASASTAAAAQRQAATETGDGLANIGRQLTAVSTAVQAVVGGQLLGGLIGDVTRTADAYANLAGKVRLVTGEGPAFQAAFDGVFDVATRTNSALEDTGVLFTKIVEAGKGLGVTQQSALALTETINQAVQLSGASAESSSAALQQLIQGLQSGVLRGDEFNSVMEQAPRLAKALADGLGVTTGELRKMAEAGELSAQTVIGALQGQAATIQTEFGKLPATVGRALQNLETQWVRYIGQVDQANGVTEKAAGAIDLLSRNLSTIGTVLLEAGKGFAALTALRLAAVFADKARAVKLASDAIEVETAATRRGTVAAAEHASALDLETAAARRNTAATAESTAARGRNAAAWGDIAQKLGSGRKALDDTAAAATKTSEASQKLGETASGAAAGLNNVGKAADGSTGRLAGLAAAGLNALSMLSRIAGAVGLVSVSWDILKGAGTWIGETAAKLTGVRDRTEELAAASEANAKAAREEAQARYAAAQATQLAADRAFGLGDASRKLVADFEKLRKEGGSTSEAIKQLAKDMDLGGVQGIDDAISALDALQAKGKITGREVRNALSEALDGKDLGLFEANARLAFDGTTRGVHRLQAALAAVSDEALKRAGTSVEELTSGLSKSFSAAMNDADALVRTLSNLGVSGDQAGRLIGESIGKALSAAKTVKEVEAIGDAINGLRGTGLTSFGAIEGMLGKVRDRAIELKEKIEDATPGVQGLGEAARKAGLDVAQLTGGLTKNGAKAIEVIQDLVTKVIETGTEAERSSPALATMFKQYLGAAKTKEELAAINLEIQRAQRSGKLFGADLRDALDQSREAGQRFSGTLKQAQADAKELGIQLKEKVGLSAEEGVSRGVHAYERLKSSGKASAAELIDGFVAIGTKAIEAAKGQVPEWVKVEAAIRGVNLVVDQNGAKLDAAAAKAASLGRVVQGALGIGQTVKAKSEVGTTPTLSGRTAASDFSVSQKSGTIGSVYTPPPDNSGDWEWKATTSKPGGEWVMSAAGSARREAQRLQQQAVLRTAYQRAGIAVPSGNAGLPLMGWPDAVRRQLLISPGTGAIALRETTATTAATTAPEAAPVAAPADPGPAAGGSRTLTIDLVGLTRGTVEMASPADAARLEAMLAALAEELRRAGGGG